MVRILKEIEEDAINKNIPIMQKDGIDFLKKYIKENNIKTILEIGTAVGYSSINMALVDEDIYITTIERDENRYNEAIRNIKKIDLGHQINIILDDAINYNTDFKYDLIFIDAAKAQNKKFFLKFKNNLTDNGVIITDNLNFHGLVDSDEKTLSRNVRGLVRKINDYKEFLKENNEFKTSFIDIGDGIAISKKVD